MILGRTAAGINKAEDAGRTDTQIGSTDVLRRIFPTVLASFLQFRGWIRLGTLCGRSSVTFSLRQCAPNDTPCARLPRAPRKADLIQEILTA